MDARTRRDRMNKRRINQLQEMIRRAQAAQPQGPAVETPDNTDVAPAALQEAAPAPSTPTVVPDPPSTDPAPATQQAP